MFIFIGRVLIYIVALGAWVFVNKKIDQLESRKEELREHKTWGKFFWLYGWSIGTNKIGVYIRYVITAIILVLVLRYFFVITSTTPTP